MKNLSPYVKHCYRTVIAVGALAFAATLVLHTPTIVIAAGFAPFAVVYIVAQALERLLEPISGVFGKVKEKKETAEDVDAAKANARTLVGADEVAAAKQKVVEKDKDAVKVEEERATFFWAVASCLGLAISAILGLGLIQSVASVNGGHPSDFFRAVDVVVTGLAIGAGTKPLHDLIESIQETKKEKKKDATAAATAL
jgi:hypothetical protein